MASKNDITGDKIQSKIGNKNFYDNFDAVFRKPAKPAEATDDWDEKRMDIIGSNGPTGEHYAEENE